LNYSSHNSWQFWWRDKSVSTSKSDGFCT